MRARELAMILGVMLVGTLAVAAPAEAATPAGAQLNVTPGLKGFDSLNVETPAQIACLSAAGYSFDLVNVATTGWAAEYQAAAAGGMDILPFQGYYQPSWPSAANGTVRANQAITSAQGVGYPRGSQIFLNLENNTNSTAATAIQWVTNWANAIRAAGYTPGVYVGEPQILSAAQVSALPVSVFWRSASSQAPQAAAGFVVRQTAVSQPACGITGGIDIDVTSQDVHGAQAKGVGFPATPTVPTVAGAYVAVSPTRLLDTRPSRVSPTGTYTLTVAGRAGVPANAAAVVLNVTAVSPTAAGNISVYPYGTHRPQASNLNFGPGQTVANLVTVPLNSGAVTLANNSAGTTQLLADVQGYYVGGTPSVSGSYHPLNPQRLLDTRSQGGAVPATGVRVVVFGGSTGVPTNAAAVVLNVTAVSPTRSGNVSVYPYATRSSASNLNFVAGQTVPNLVTVPLNGGAVSLANNSSGSTQLLVDLEGFYLPGTGTMAGTFVAVAPTRLLDTRQTGAPLGPVAGQALRVSGSAPAAGAVVANLTVTGPTAAGHLTASRPGSTCRACPT